MDRGCLCRTDCAKRIGLSRSPIGHHNQSHRCRPVLKRSGNRRRISIGGQRPIREIGPTATGLPQQSYPFIFARGPRVAGLPVTSVQTTRCCGVVFLCAQPLPIQFGGRERRPVCVRHAQAGANGLRVESIPTHVSARREPLFPVQIRVKITAKTKRHPSAPCLYPNLYLCQLCDCLQSPFLPAREQVATPTCPAPLVGKGQG